jgi:hypothetical protein
MTCKASASSVLSNRRILDLNAIVVYAMDADVTVSSSVKSPDSFAIGWAAS